jgi:hypothetical protein
MRRPKSFNDRCKSKAFDAARYRRHSPGINIVVNLAVCAVTPESQGLTGAFCPFHWSAAIWAS